MQYQNEATSIWANRGGSRPLDTPICGFTGNQCPVNVTPYIALGSSVILILLLIASGAVVFAVRARIRERERMNKECLISFAALRPIAHVGGDGSQQGSVSTSETSLDRPKRTAARSRVSIRSSTSSKTTTAADRWVEGLRRECLGLGFLVGKGWGLWWGFKISELKFPDFQISKITLPGPSA